MREMSRAEHETQRALILRSLLLADTRSERHGVYPTRRPRPLPRSWVLPVVNERRRL